MHAGKLRHKVTVQSVSEAKNAYGGMVDTWSDAFTTWANVMPVGQKEFTAQDKLQTEITHKIHMRHDSNTSTITPKHRIQFDGRTFDIQQVINLHERDIRLEILAIERG